MHNLSNIGVRTLVGAAALATGATSTGNYIDTLGWDEAKILVFTITGGNTSSVPDQIVIGHTDDTNSWGTFSSYTTASYGSAVQATSSTNVFCELNVPQLQKRFLRISITGAGAGETSATVGAICLLTRADKTPTGTNTGSLTNITAT